MATAPAGASDAAPKGKKKLIIMIAAVVLLLVVAGGAAMFMMKKKAADADSEDGGEADHAPAAHAKIDPKHPPVFLPLEPFTVNLADRETDRFAQVGITLEVVDAPTGEQMKAFMPAIRSNVLMLLAHKTAAELLTLEGKQKLAREIQRAAVLPMGIELDIDDEDAEHQDEGAAPKKKKKKKKATTEGPVSKVHFSNFIVQ
jgi:flagellar FliL protein